MNNYNKTVRLAVMGVLSGITVLFCFITLPMFGLELSFAMVPVAVGAAVYGTGAGAVLGGVFGAVSFLQCFSYSPFGVMMFTLNPWRCLLVCLPTRILAGLAAGAVCSLLKKKTAGQIAACFLAPALNTVFFMTALLLLYWNTPEIKGIASNFGTVSPVAFAVAFVGLQGVIELVAGFAVALPVSKAVQKTVGKRKI